MYAVKNFTTIIFFLNRCVESCNTYNDLPNKVSVPNTAEDLNLSLFSMITRRNESKHDKAYIMRM